MDGAKEYSFSQRPPYSLESPPQHRLPWRARAVQTASRMPLTSGQGMNIPNLPLLNPERMAIRRRHITRSVQSREPNIYVHNTHLHINHVPSIRNMNRTRQTKVTRIISCQARIRIRTALKPSTRRAIRNCDIRGSKTVEVSVASGLDNVGVVALQLWNGIPLFQRIVVGITCGVESPVPGICD